MLTQLKYQKNCWKNIKPIVFDHARAEFLGKSYTKKIAIYLHYVIYT